MIRRIRVHAGLWMLIALLGLAMVCVLAATPRTANRMADNALRRAVAQAPGIERDLMFVQPTSPTRLSHLGPSPERLLNGIDALLPEALRATVGAKWGAIGTGWSDLDGPGVTTEPESLKPVAGVWHLVGLEREITLTEGRLPATRRDAAGAASAVEVVVAATIAQQFGLHVGGSYTVRGSAVQVVGLFKANDPTAAVWDPHDEALEVGYDLGSEGRVRWSGLLFTDPAGITTLWGDPGWQMVTTARYRLDEHRLNADLVADLRTEMAKLRSDPLIKAADVALDSRLEDLLTDFQRAQAAFRGLLGVVGAGLAGATLGLLVLAARLTVDRRRAELRLLRARGASLGRIGAMVGLEASAVVVPAMLTGWLAHHLVPGRAGAGSLAESAPVLAVAVVALLAVPVTAVLSQRDRRDQTTGGRRDIALSRPGPRRLVAEVALVVVAGLGVLLVHRRGLVVAGVDPYLSAVPVLVAVATGLVALRVFPGPVRLLGRLTRRRRGAPLFLGLARAGRGGGGVAVPLVVLVLAVALGGFAGAIRSGIANARDAAAVNEVGATSGWSRHGSPRPLWMRWPRCRECAEWLPCTGWRAGRCPLPASSSRTA